MSPWTEATLGDLTAARRPICYGVLKPGPFVPDGVPLLRVVDLAADRVDLSAAHRISSSLDHEFRRSRLRGGEVLLSIQGTVGRVALAPPEAAGANISRTVAVIEPDERVIPGFLRYFLLTQRQQFKIGGTTRASLNIGDLRKVRVPLPPLDEQHRIVAVLEDHLSRLDAANAYVSGATRRADTLVLGQLVSALLGGPAVSAVARAAVVADSGELPSLPADWRWSRLGQLCDVVGGVTKDAAKQHSPGLLEVPYLRVANVQRGRLDLKTIKTIRVAQEKLDVLRLEPGDVLLNEGGDRDKLGRGWVWAGEIDDCIHQNHVFRARVRDAAVPPRLLSWWANTVGGAWCERHGRQSVNLASISLRRILEMPVPVPPKWVQRSIEEDLSDLHAGVQRLSEAVTAASSQSQRLRTMLFSMAFSGRL